MHSQYYHQSQGHTIGVAGVPEPAGLRLCAPIPSTLTEKGHPSPLPLPPSQSPPRHYLPPSPSPTSSSSSAATLFLSRRANHRRDATFLRAPHPLPLPLQPQPSSSPAEPLTAVTLPSSEPLTESSSAE
nr:lysine-rich arabinogalactan protein 19-like [Arachis hypogaea]